VKKRRELLEGPEWQASREKIDPDLARFDETFRFMAENISAEPRVNTTPFLDDDDHRILVGTVPGIAELWVYFRIAADDESCTLLWIESAGGAIGFRVG
jgi:hypothetical protein